MATKLMSFIGGPWDGQELPVDVAPNGGILDRWDMIQENWVEREIADMLSNPLGANLRASRIQIRHEYWLTNEADGRPGYVHQDEREW